MDQSVLTQRTPWEIVTSRFDFPKEVMPGVPFIPHPLQIEAINELAVLPEQGHWMDVGTGKTFMVTAVALYLYMTYGRIAVAIMPPHLVTQWGRWLAKVTDRTTGEPLVVVEYAGTPAKREKMQFVGMQFILASVRIFVGDFDRFIKLPRGKLFYIVDEAHTILANVETKQFEKMHKVLPTEYLAALTGTPGATPMKAYGLIKFVAPGIYRNISHFRREHVEELDFWGKPVSFKNLDKLKAALEVNSKRILYSDMYGDLETPRYIPLEYRLDPAHKKLYNKLSKEKVKELEDGGKMDTTNVSRLIHALGQIVLNWEHFSEDPANKSTGLRVMESIISEVPEGEKVVVFCHYRMTVARICKEFEHLGYLPYNGEVSRKDKDATVDRFMSDPSCRGIVVQYRSGAAGLDGLQYASRTMIMAEPGDPGAPDIFTQCVGRLMRRGQKHQVKVYLMQALGTLQPGRVEGLLNSDRTSGLLIRNAIDLMEQLGVNDS